MCTTRKRTIVCVVATVVALLVFAPAPAVAHISYMPSSPEVQSLLEIYAAAGRVFPSASFPISKRDLHRFALDLRQTRPALAQDIDRYLEHLEFRPGEVTINAKIDTEFRAYLRSSDTQWINEELEYDSLDLDRRYIQMPDFLSLTLFSQQDDTGGMYINAGIKRRYERGELLDSNFLEFDPDRIIRADHYFIRRGYFFHYFGDLELILGRNGVHLGGPEHSTFMASDRLPHIDSLTLRYRLGPIYMTSVSATLDNRRADGELDPDSQAFCDAFERAERFEEDACDPDGDGYWPSERLGFNRTVIYYGVHRFDYTRDTVRLGIAAQQFVARENNAFHLGDVFPVFSWHNTDVGGHNMSLIMDASWRPRPYWELFFQAGYNDIDANELVGIPDDPIPTIDAYLLGVSYRGPVASRRLRATAEVGYTHFLWGNNYDYHEERGNYLSRGVYRLRTHGFYMMPMTSPYGPGTAWTRLRSEVGEFGPVSLGLDFELLSRQDRELVNLVNTIYYPNDEDYSAYEDASREMIWRVAPQVKVRTERFGSYFLEPAVHGWKDDVWWELTIGGSYSVIWTTSP